MTSKKPTPPPPIKLALPITGRIIEWYNLGLVLDGKSFVVHF
jgi:hypothetical protein